jgi:hypothetical protein
VGDHGACLPGCLARVMPLKFLNGLRERLNKCVFLLLVLFLLRNVYLL